MSLEDKIRSYLGVVTASSVVDEKYKEIAKRTIEAVERKDQDAILTIKEEVKGFWPSCTDRTIPVIGTLSYSLSALTGHEHNVESAEIYSKAIKS